nr:unnamed protein product [Callosobruchus chinensis]
MRYLAAICSPYQSTFLKFVLFDTTYFFFRELKVACTNALAGKKLSQEIGVEKVDKSLVANFEILNLHRK